MEKEKTTDRPAGAWILKEDGTLVPDMNDEAMKARLLTAESVKEETKKVK